MIRSDDYQSFDPSSLPPPGAPERWAWLQQLRRQPRLEIEPWLQALERGALAGEADLVTVLVERASGAQAGRLLAWWLHQESPDPALAERVGRIRHPDCAVLLRQALVRSPSQAPLLLPLLGHQRERVDAPLLSRLALEPGPLALRRSALEGLAVGLSAWPIGELRRTLSRLAGDLDPVLAAEAVDLLARLPRPRQALLGLDPAGLEAGVAVRLARRLHALPPSALLLLVHGRSGGVIPAELLALREALAQRRGTTVRLLTLTAPAGSAQAARASEDWMGEVTLVPLFLLPGSHVRQDLPLIAAHWRERGRLRRLPFLGAWPAWQRALRAELAERTDAAQGRGGPEQPRLVHHPVEGALGRRYLRHLRAVTGAICIASPYSAADLEALTLTIPTGALPLTLAANRLTDSLGDLLGPPLLQRPRFRALLLESLGALP